MVKSFRNAFLFLIGLILINVLFQRFFTRFDFTQEKRFTLSKPTLKILKNLSTPITVQVFLEGDFPAPFKRLRKESLELLNEFSAYSHGMIHVQFLDPFKIEGGNASTLVDTLYKYGLQPTQVQAKTQAGTVQKEIFPGAFIQSGKRRLSVNLLQNQSQLGSERNTEALINYSVEGLEYTFIEAIKKITDSSPPTVGILTGNGETFGPQIADLLKSLKSSKRVGGVNLDQYPLDSLIQIQVLVLIKPRIRFTEVQKYKLDQFIIHGGKLIAFIDQVQAELDSMGKNGSTIGLGNNLNLDDLFFRLGVRLNYNLIRDLNCSAIPVLTGPEGSNSGQNLEPWVYYPLVLPASIHPIVRNLDPVRLEFASTLDTLASRGIQKTFLLSTSPYTKLAATPVNIQLSELSDPANDAEAYKGGKQNVAVLLEGRFRSSFLNRTIEGADHSLPFLAMGKPSSVIVVADGNLPLNQVNSLEKSIYPLGFDKYTQQVFGNKVFVENAIDYFTDADGLLTLRSKEVKLRLLNKPLVEETKNTEQMLNFLVPILWVILSGLGFAAFRRYKYVWLKG